MLLLRFVKGGVNKKALRDLFYQNGSWWAYPPNGVIPVRIHEIIDVENTLAQRVKVKYYSIYLSIALLPDGCVAPHNHPEI